MSTNESLSKSQFFHQRKNYDERIDTYSKKIQNNSHVDFIQSSSPEASSETDDATSLLFLRAVTCLKKGDLTESLKDLSKILQKSPNHEEALYIRGLIYYKQKLYPESVGDLSLLLSLNPNHTRASMTRAACLHQLGLLSIALEDYARALSIPVESLPFLTLADLKKQMNMTDNEIENSDSNDHDSNDYVDLTPQEILDSVLESVKVSSPKEEKKLENYNSEDISIKDISLEKKNYVETVEEQKKINIEEIRESYDALLGNPLINSQPSTPRKSSFSTSSNPSISFTSNPPIASDVSSSDLQTSSLTTTSTPLHFNSASVPLTPRNDISSTYMMNSELVKSFNTNLQTSQLLPSNSNTSSIIPSKIFSPRSNQNLSNKKSNFSFDSVSYNTKLNEEENQLDKKLSNNTSNNYLPTSISLSSSVQLSSTTSKNPTTSTPSMTTSSAASTLNYFDNNDLNDFNENNYTNPYEYEPSAVIRNNENDHIKNEQFKLEISSDNMQAISEYFSKKNEKSLDKPLNFIEKPSTLGNSTLKSPEINENNQSPAYLFFQKAIKLNLESENLENSPNYIYDKVINLNQLYENNLYTDIMELVKNKDYANNLIDLNPSYDILMNSLKSLTACLRFYPKHRLGLLLNLKILCKLGRINECEDIITNLLNISKSYFTNYVTYGRYGYQSYYNKMKEELKEYGDLPPENPLLFHYQLLIEISYIYETVSSTLPLYNILNDSIEIYEKYIRVMNKNDELGREFYKNNVKNENIDDILPVILYTRRYYYGKSLGQWQNVLNDLCIIITYHENLLQDSSKNNFLCVNNLYYYYIERAKLMALLPIYVDNKLDSIDELNDDDDDEEDLQNELDIIEKDKRDSSSKSPSIRLPTYLIESIIHDLSSAIHIDSNDGHLYLMRADCYEYIDMSEEALKDLMIAESLHTVAGDIPAKKGRILAKKELFYEAISEFSKSLAMNSNLVTFNRWDLEVDNDRIKNYLNENISPLLSTFIKLNYSPFPTITTSFLFYMRGVSYRMTQQFERAASDFTAVIMYNSENYHALQHRGYCLRKIGRIDEAIDDYSKILTILLNKREKFVNKISKTFQIYQEMNQILTDKLQYLDNLLLKILISRAYLYVQNHSYYEAIDDYTHSLILDPNNLHALHNRAITYDKVGMINESMIDLARVFELDSGKHHNNSNHNFLSSSTDFSSSSSFYSPFSVSNASTNSIYSQKITNQFRFESNNVTYASQNAPFSPQNVSYAPQNTPFLPQNAPYPPQNIHFSIQHPNIAPQNNQSIIKNIPYAPPINPQHPSQQQNQNPYFQSQNLPYQTQNQRFPSSSVSISSKIINNNQSHNNLINKNPKLSLVSSLDLSNKNNSQLSPSISPVLSSSTSSLKSSLKQKKSSIEEQYEALSLSRGRGFNNNKSIY